MADRPDGFDFEPNGTILCFIEGEKWKLRRPKTGEFKVLRLALRDRDDELNKLQGEAVASEVDREDAAEAADQGSALAAAERTLSTARTLTDRREELDQQWIADTFELLADSPLPADRDDWPVWLWQAENLSKLIDHWRSVPLARGPS